MQLQQMYGDEEDYGGEGEDDIEEGGDQWVR